MKSRPKSKPLKLEVVKNNPNSSFLFIQNDLLNFNFPWHYHPELEISLVTKGGGMRVVGDSIQNFSEGDLCLLGSKIPHTWYSKPKENENVSSLVLQFSNEFITQKLMKFSEFNHFNKVIQLSKRGMLIKGEAKTKISSLILDIQDLSPSSPLRVSKFILILAEISQCIEYELLITPTYEAPVDNEINQKVEIISQLIHNHLHSPLTQNWVATKVGMSSAGFSRYFRRVFGKSYVEYINELRIGMACRILFEEPKKSITKVAYDLGFNNLTHFNRLFKKFKKKTPREYRSQVTDYSENE